LAALKPQLKDLEKQLDKVKKQLEDETLLRVDLENKNQTMKEELSFKTNVYDKEINQLRTSKRVEVEQADLRLRDEYDSRLISELQRMREEADEKIQEMKQEIDKRYQTKTGDTESAAKSYQNSIQT
jgi:dsDNA-specific endonuclease/ATPase MutS2